MRRIGEMKLKRFCLLAAIALTVVVSSAWAEPIGEVKSKPAGWSGYISGFVTAIFPDYGCMVVEEADRSAAITVRPALSLGIGTEVLILGTLQEDGTFLSSRTTPTGFVNTVSPVGMPNKAITGATGDSGLSNLD
ncbi:MAG: hypothetical protein HYY29_01390, partial [Chloroflexi bacterium]|nr:hypothetical protein [Chloroflexota bacterium]